MKESFGSLLKDARIRQGLILRACCLKLCAEPGLWSKMERGIDPAPAPLLLEQWMEALQLEPAEREHMRALAAESRREVSGDLAPDDVVAGSMPAFKRLDQGKLLKLARTVRELHTPSPVSRIS